MKLGVLLAGRRPEDIAKRLEQAREAGFSVCQLNLMQTGVTRADMLAVADSMLEYGIRPAAIGCYLNPIKPADPDYMGVIRADLEVILQSLDILGARRIVMWSGTHAEGLFDEDPGNQMPSSLNQLSGFLADVVRTTKARRYLLVLEPWKTHILNHERVIARFHEALEPAVAEKVRYVLDAPNLLTADRYQDKDKAVLSIARTVGPLAGLVHLKDCVMPPDGDESLAAPGEGKLDYPAYIAAIQRFSPPDVAAIIKNVPPEGFADARDYFLKMDAKWELV